MTKKRSFRKRFNIFPIEWQLQNTLLIVINIHNVIKWYHLDNNITFKKLSTFTLDVFLIGINLIYKSLFNHQPFDSSSIINTLKLFAKKKKYKFGG